ncbi:RsbRD N-terminal domain-containing protein [Chloroflexota bacterium]
MTKILDRFLLQKKVAILERWRLLILDTYPADGSRFFKQEKDRFANPIGSIISEGIEALYDELVGEMNQDNLFNCLDSIIRVRAVQDFPPSDAIAFIPLLKRVVREELGGEIKERRLFEDILKFESRIDDMMLLTLDIYMKCREQIHEIRIKELKEERDGVLRLLARTNSKDEEPSKE